MLAKGKCLCKFFVNNFCYIIFVGFFILEECCLVLTLIVLMCWQQISEAKADLALKGFQFVDSKAHS